MNVAFVNENTLGHASYLLPFVAELRKRPELGVVPHVIDATPLPPSRSHWANFSVRGLRKWGLDFGIARWRMSISAFVRDEVERLRSSCALDAIVVNTQSAGLALPEVAASLPIFVSLDATFEQLSSSAWFAPNLGSRLFLPVTAAPIRRSERRLFHAARRLLPWSEAARQSLLDDYHCSPEKIGLLPPSIDLRAREAARKTNARQQILFVGGDFRRKGGNVLLECYRRWFRPACDLHIVTHSPIEPEEGVYVHHNVQPYSDLWLERWQGADVFVFPSTLETFGIVLLEALAFQAPVISSDVGAARFVLAGGKAGWLLQDRRPETLAGALREVLGNPAAARQRAREGRKLVEERFDLSRNTERLANWLWDAVAPRAKERLA